MALNAQEFSWVCDLVRRESAIVLGPGKEYLVESRLLPLARKAGMSSVTEYISTAQRRPVPGMTKTIVEALTTNETSWFRDIEPFSLLTESVLPALTNSRGSGTTVRIWSAACSSGQEPYSVAMLLQDKLPPGWSYQIHATDLSTEMLTRAEGGRFSQLEMNRGLPAPMLVRHFDRVGADWQVAAALRKHITFAQVNLAGALPAVPPFDVVFLRNVLIYFDLDTKRSILQRVRKLLRPEGWLFLGSAETTLGLDGDFERVATRKTSVYRLKSGYSALASA
ncbi:MAG TPA: CheR family methyltransferase [Mycobacteriales bacterium]|nr:CheR family methyltransferase [Mycobacteriales bacterium]